VLRGYGRVEDSRRRGTRVDATQQGAQVGGGGHIRAFALRETCFPSDSVKAVRFNGLLQALAEQLAFHGRPGTAALQFPAK
jgi:hypothetical protein